MEASRPTTARQNAAASGTLELRLMSFIITCTGYRRALIAIYLETNGKLSKSDGQAGVARSFLPSST